MERSKRNQCFEDINQMERTIEIKIKVAYTSLYISQAYIEISIKNNPKFSGKWYIKFKPAEMIVNHIHTMTQIQNYLSTSW